MVGLAAGALVFGALAAGAVVAGALVFGALAAGAIGLAELGGAIGEAEAGVDIVLVFDVFAAGLAVFVLVAASPQAIPRAPSAKSDAVAMILVICL